MNAEQQAWDSGTIPPRDPEAVPLPPRLEGIQAEEQAARERVALLPAEPLARAEMILLGAELEAALGREYSARLHVELAGGWLRVAELRAARGEP